MDADTILIIVTIFVMVNGLLVSLLPMIPGPVIIWIVGLAFGIIDGFERIPIPAFAVFTALMIIGSTSGVWTQLVGIQARGGSCLTAFGSLLGGLLGTFFIPIPFIGTLAGAILGAWSVELMRVGDLEQSIRAARAATEMYLVSIIIDFAIGVCMIIVFLISIWLTA